MLVSREGGGPKPAFLNPDFQFELHHSNLWMSTVTYVHPGLNVVRATSRGAFPVGEKQNQQFRLSFYVSLKLDSQGSRLPSHGSLILVRELYERLGYEDLNDAERVAADPTFRFISSQRIWKRGATLIYLALVRDRAAYQGRESDRADGVEPGAAGADRVSQ
jgi:hypothetical protein